MSERKKAIVTGGSRGIGAACALELASAGYDVAIIYNSSRNKAEEVRDEALKKNFAAKVYQADVSDYLSCQRAVEEILKDFGKIDVLVNNAGINGHKPFLETSIEFAKRLYEVNCLSLVYMDHLVIPGMVDRNYGRVVSVTSVGGLMGFAGNAEYSGSKAAAIGRMKAIAKELGPYNVTYNIVAPGCTKTDMVAASNPEDVEATRLATPLRRLLEPKDIADAVMYFVEAENTTGQVLSPNGGLYM